jgi:hypothetical protein
MIPGEILSCAHGNFEQQMRSWEFCIIINYYFIVIVKTIIGRQQRVESVLRKSVKATNNFSSFLICIKNYSLPAAFDSKKKTV